MDGPDDGEHHQSVVAIGASGSSGLLDMADILALLPASFPGTVLLTLHRPVDRPSNLARVLQRVSALPVVIAGQMQHLQPGTCYIGEPAAHLTLCSPTAIGLVADPWHAYRNRTIDLLFDSVAAYAADRAIGVVLSGCLSDGSRGLAAIMGAGGISMARDPWQHVQGDMPRNAIASAGPLHCVDCVDCVPSLVQAIVVHATGTRLGFPPPPAAAQLISVHRL